VPEAKQQNLAVLGSPIRHSKSPALHAAAYAALSLPWSYQAVEMTGVGLGEFLSSRDESWRGLSLTMPLKRDILPYLSARDPLVDIAEGANTVVFEGTGAARTLTGYNTDVYGIRRAFLEAGVPAIGYVHILGGGATAASALIAANQLGAERALISVRSPLKALSIAQLADTLGMDVTVRDLSVPDSATTHPDVIVSTLPGGTPLDLDFLNTTPTDTTLFDVAYDPWPSALAARWMNDGGRVISGLEMLIYQALAQVRLFTGSTSDTPLPNETGVLEAMRAAVTP
jgi:shikimate dehydrogenase